MSITKHIGKEPAIEILLQPMLMRPTHFPSILVHADSGPFPVCIPVMDILAEKRSLDALVYGIPVLQTEPVAVVFQVFVSEGSVPVGIQVPEIFETEGLPVPPPLPQKEAEEIRFVFGF